MNANKHTHFHIYVYANILVVLANHSPACKQLSVISW